MQPFKTSGTTVVSFSGGRTSAYMLRLVLDKKRRPLNWYDPVKRLTLPVDAPLAAINTLRFAYSALLDAPGGVVVHVDADGEYQGSISHALLQNVLEGHVDLRRYD